MGWEPRWRAQARETFAARFEPDGSDYLFRPTPTSHPVRVSAAEFDGAVRSFLAGQLYLMAFLVVGTLVAISALIWFDLSDDNNVSLWLVTGTLIGIFAIGWYRLWRAPSRMWAHRAPAGAARDRQEAARLQMAATSYLKIAAIAGGGILLVAVHLFDPRATAGDRWWYSGFGLFVIACGLFGAWRKWSSDRRG